MNVLFMARETRSSLPALEYLISNNINIVFAVVREQDERLCKICRMHGIRFGREEQFWESYNGNAIDWLLSFYWKRIKKDMLSLPEKGSINFHPGPLPEARGSGYHASILEEWGYWGVTAHYIDEEYDTGDIIRCERFQIPNEIINRELVKMAHERLTELFKGVIDDINEGRLLKGKSQSNGRYFSHEDIEKAKYISREDDSETINRKILAFWNPPYSGAKIVIDGEEFTLINNRILKYISENTKE